MSNEKRGKFRLFYATIFFIALFLLTISVFDFFPGEDSNHYRIYEAITTDFAVALLIVVALYVIKSFSFLSDDGKELLKNSKENSIKIEEIERTSNETRVIANKIFESGSGGLAYTERDGYYEEYYSLLGGARISAKLIGDGFRCHTAENEERALLLFNAMRRALQNGAIVSRFQYNNTLSIKWLTLLLALLDSDMSRDKFRLYMNDRRDPTAMPSVICLVDPDTDAASVNIMFTMNADTRLGEKLGGPAFVFKSSKSSALKMELAMSDYFEDSFICSRQDINDKIAFLFDERKSRVKTYIESKNVSIHSYTKIREISRATKVPDVELIDLTLAECLNIERVLYFSFGSNMTDERIRVPERAPSAICIDRGYIENYEMCFNMRGNKDQGKGGGIANISKHPSRRVYGALYLINRDDFERLENREASMGYATETLSVNKRGFGVVDAQVFVSTSPSNKYYEPTLEYKQLILDGMEAQRFPSNYIRGIIKLMGRKCLVVE